MAAKLSPEKRAILTRDFLYQEYYVLKKSHQKIANDVGVCRNIIQCLCKSFGIIARTHQEQASLRNLSGKNNPMFKTGYCINKPRCKDCGKLLGSFYAKRCKSCSTSGQLNPHYGKRPTHGRWTKYAGINFRSPWEAAYAQYLDKLGIKWYYEFTTFKGLDYTYTPDFYLPETNQYIEIKGWWTKQSLLKIQKFIIDFPTNTLSVLCKHSLKNLGVLK